MRKIILLVTVILLTTTAFTQISFGPKVGYYASKLSVDKSDIKSDIKSSFQFGAFLRLGTKIYVQPEIIWATEGAVFKDEGIGFEDDIELKTIQFPLLVGVKVFDLKVANLRIHGGPTASIVTNKTINKVDDLESGLDDADFEDLIWSFQVGAGIDVLMLTLDVRYNIGISKVIGEVDGIAYDSKTSGFNVSLGWKIL
ncbi:MAG: PorT family protein [Bacteroidetes bacterium]|nr:PorT family protein [Bacteroidota bacterium]